MLTFLRIQCRRVYPGVLIATLGLAASACGCGSHDPAVRRVTVIAIDRSASTGAPSIRQSYFEGITKIVNSLATGDVLVMYPITANTTASSYQQKTIVFPTYDPITINQDQYQSNLMQTRAEAESIARTWLRTSCPDKNTDLLYGLQPAGNILNGGQYGHYPVKRLIVFSDGIEQSEGWDFTAVGLTQKEDASIINKLETLGAVPDLRGTDIWWAGATAAPQGGLRPVRAMQIRQFWQTYLTSAGGRLSPTDYGASLQNYPDDP